MVGIDMERDWLKSEALGDSSGKVTPCANKITNLSSVSKERCGKAMKSSAVSCGSSDLEVLRAEKTGP